MKGKHLFFLSSQIQFMKIFSVKFLVLECPVMLYDISQSPKTSEVLGKGIIE